MQQSEVVEEATTEKPIIEKKGRGRPRKAIVPHTLPTTLGGIKYQEYRELYYTDDNQMVGIKKIEERIQQADLTISKNITQTALDIYFVRANWKTFYSREKGKHFDSWLKNTIPLSRSYVWDILKCVKELVAFKSGNVRTKELDDLLLASIKEVFTKYDISLLREVIHLPKTVKSEYLGKLMDTKVTVDKAEVRATKNQSRSKNEAPRQNVVVDHVLIVNTKPVLSLESLAAEDPALTAELEKAIERAYKKYIKKQG